MAIKLIKYLEQAKEGLFNLYFAKLRSLLALLGVLVGTASVVAMVLGGELATHEALKQFQSLGTDLLAISINMNNDYRRDASGKVDQLTLSEAEALSAVDDNILDVAPYTQLFHPVYYHGQLINGMILGVTDSFAKIVHIKLSQGRFVSTVDKYGFYCVVGRDIYETIKSISHTEPLGDQLQINKNIFTIVGIAEDWPENNFVYANINTSIMVPLLASSILSQYASITNIIMRLSPTAAIDTVQERISAAIKKILSEKNISFRSAKELLNKMKKQNDILTVFLGLIGSVSLIVGGIGVMNIMLVSVIERRREIGIRLAVGAKRTDIGMLFLLEAVMLSLVGGVVGVLIGILIAYVIALLWHWQFILFVWPPLVGFSVSVGVGIFSGFYPAYLASRLDPIEALRGV